MKKATLKVDKKYIPILFRRRANSGETIGNQIERLIMKSLTVEEAKELNKIVKKYEEKNKKSVEQ